MTVNFEQARSLDAIVVRDTSQSALRSADPCIELLALTVRSATMGAAASPIPGCNPATELGPWPSTGERQPVDKPVAFDFDATRTGALAVLDVWIPGVSPAGVEYELWVEGRAIHFNGAGDAWLYADCDQGIVYSQVVQHEQDRARQGKTTITISLKDFADRFPGYVIPADGLGL